MTVVVNIRRAKYDVYIGRGPAGRIMDGERGQWGNPFRKHKEAALEKYEHYLLKRLANEPHFRDRVAMLCGKVLGCFCAGSEPLEPATAPLARCHGQILALAAEALGTGHGVPWNALVAIQAAIGCGCASCLRFIGDE